MIAHASADLELARDIGMTRKKIAIVLGMLCLIGLFILRWILRTPTEADVRNQRAIPSAETPAAVAHIKRGRIEDTLTIAGAFKPFQDVDIHAKGIVVPNSILIVEFVRHLRQEGKSIREAVSTASRLRLRPILMTSLATLLGMIPMGLGIEAGSEAYAPLARAIIGGLLVSVAVTVYLVPAAYLIIHRQEAHPTELPA